jgi:hypothetical protein
MIFRPARILWIVLLVFSSLWVALIYFSLLYAVMFPPSDLQEIVRALETRGPSPSQADTVVQRAIAADGPLRRAVRVGYYSGVVTNEHTSSQKMKMTEVRYLAWFDGLPSPILLVLQRYENAGGLQGYAIESGKPLRLVPAFALPLFALVFSIYTVSKKKSASLD